MIIFTLVILLIHEYERSVHVFLISFNVEVFIVEVFYLLVIFIQ